MSLCQLELNVMKLIVLTFDLCCHGNQVTYYSKKKLLYFWAKANLNLINMGPNMYIINRIPKIFTNENTTSWMHKVDLAGKWFRCYHGNRPPQI